MLPGAQAALGWYMVRSGLEEPVTDDAVPRVSYYRLAAHLSTVLALSGGMFATALSVTARRGSHLQPVPLDGWAHHAAHGRTLFLQRRGWKYVAQFL